ncbi:unnamed protein product [Owenia fusiformis]|uniref:DET1- and DDB1-associated protein 1 n=1 Tax=Owenia fusiformis TaxID=6347 RepID=A0A8J1TUJ0_OWEFU|nr:unnamed protein product [Owenia fusiformis]
MANFLQGLPSHNSNNFTKYQQDASCKTTIKKPAVYISTVDHPSDQVITTEKTNILLRYLHQQWGKKNAQKKRDSNRADLETTESPSAAKVPRLNNSSSREEDGAS